MVRSGFGEFVANYVLRSRNKALPLPAPFIFYMSENFLMAIIQFAKMYAGRVT
jgi:hypothetical protein